MSETEKMNVQAQGEERATTQEYIQTVEVTRNELMDMVVVMKAIRSYAIDSPNEAALKKQIEYASTQALKWFLITTSGVSGYAAWIAAKSVTAIAKYLLTADKVDLRASTTQGINAMEKLVNQMTANPTWQRIRVPMGVLAFVNENVKIFTSCGAIQAVQINGSWQN